MQGSAGFRKYFGYQYLRELETISFCIAINKEISIPQNSEKYSVQILRNTCAGEAVRLNCVVAFEDAYEWRRDKEPC